MMELRKAGRLPGVADHMRHMAALGRQIDDAEALAQALEIRTRLDEEIAAAVQRLYGEGYSCADLAAPIGCTRQAVAKRWPRSTLPQSAA